MHLIQQHIFDIQCSSQNFGKEMLNQLSLLLEKEFYPKLELLFNKYDSKSNTLTIDVLDIELPTISKKYWKEELIQKSLSQIEEYLKRNQLFDSSEKDLVSTDFISNSNHAKNLFFEFLKTGKIIENTLSKNLEKIVYEIDVNEVFIEEIISIFIKNRNYLIRWIFSIPDFFKEIVLNKLGNFTYEFSAFFNVLVEKKKVLNELVEKVIHKISEDKIVIKQWLELINWIKYLENKGVSKDTLFTDFIQLTEQFFEIKPQEVSVVCQYILETNFQTSERSAEIKNFFEKIESSIPQHIISESKLKKLENSFPEENVYSNKAKKGNSHYINNAGLVLLNPFLNGLFEQLNLCDTYGSWVTKISQHKAILLTQYLINSREGIQESDLLLNKILCGFPVEAVVNVKLKITKKEKDKCNNLLEAVKEHWKEMSTSSIEALQEIFLQREAKLEFVSEDKFELWVEEKGVDILLEQLPWGIGMIQTPWMENYLHCHWS